MAWAAWLLWALPGTAVAQQAIGEARIYATERIVIGGSTFGSTSPLQVIGLPNLAGTIATVDGSGNIGLAATGTATISAILSATGAVNLGDASGDDVAVNGRLTTALVWKTDNTNDIGASGANRARDFFLGRNAAIGGTLGVTGASTLAALSATTGTFSGDVAVNGNDITSTGALTVRPTGNLTLDPTGDVIIAADGAELLPATTYAYNIGAFSNKFNVIHAAELWIQTLVAQETIATIGGRILVAPTTQLSAALGSAIGDTTITVKHNNLANGDRIYLEAAGSVEFMAVTSAAGGTSGAYTYSVTRDLDGSGRNAWLAGDAVVNTGTTGDGFIDLYALRSTKSATEYGPTIVGNVRNSTTYNDWSPRWAAGNLNGIYGYSADTYGFAAGNPSDTYFKIDATDGFQIYDGATRKFWLTTSGSMALYDSTTTYLQLTGGAIKMVEGGVEVFNLSSGVATFGQPMTSNNTGQIRIDSDSIDFRWRNNSGSTATVLQISNSAGDAYFSMTGAMAISAYLRVPSVTNSAGDLVVGSEAVLGDVILSATGATRPDADGNRSLGESGYRWQKLFLLPTTTTSTFNPLVLGTNGEVWEKTDGVSATFNPTTCTSMTFEGGILTAKAGC